MKKILPLLLLLLLLTAPLLCCGGCATRERITGLPADGDLRGLRVGVVLGWNADYYLDQTDLARDLKLMRYNTIASAVLAMKYGYVDVMALEMASAGLLCRNMPAFTVLDEPLAADQILLYVTGSRADLRDAFNAFIAGFRQTAEYADLLSRTDAAFLGDYQYREVPAIGGGEKIVVACEDYYPYCYWDFERDCIAGMEVELVTRFANACNYRVEFRFSSFSAAIMDLSLGRVDMMADGLSGYYENFAEQAGILCTDPYYTTQLVWVAVRDESLLEGGMSEEILQYY